MSSLSLEERLAKEGSDVDRLLVLLMDVFSEHGFKGTSLYRIAERTALTKVRLKRIFPGGKDQMATEVLEYIEACFQDEVFGALEREKPPKLSSACGASSKITFASGDGSAWSEGF
jgi:hypothetical protein